MGIVCWRICSAWLNLCVLYIRLSCVMTTISYIYMVNALQNCRTMSAVRCAGRTQCDTSLISCHIIYKLNSLQFNVSNAAHQTWCPTHTPTQHNTYATADTPTHTHNSIEFFVVCDAPLDTCGYIYIYGYYDNVEAASGGWNHFAAIIQSMYGL